LLIVVNGRVDLAYEGVDIAELAVRIGKVGDRILGDEFEGLLVGAEGGSSTDSTRNGPRTVVEEAVFRTPNFAPDGWRRPDAMWVGPPSPAQPDSLGFGIIELGEGGPDGCIRRDGRASQRSQVAIVDEAGVLQRNRNLPNDPAKLVPILGELPPGTPVAFEAAYGGLADRPVGGVGAGAAPGPSQPL
jgi:hypothetical protein